MYKWNLCFNCRPCTFKDGIIIEKQDGSGENPYVNIIAVRTEDKDNADYKKIADAYHTQIVAEYLIGKYEESFSQHLHMRQKQLMLIVKL